MSSATFVVAVLISPRIDIAVKEPVVANVCKRVKQPQMASDDLMNLSPRVLPSALRISSQRSISLVRMVKLEGICFDFFSQPEPVSVNALYVLGMSLTGDAGPYFTTPEGLFDSWAAPCRGYAAFAFVPLPCISIQTVHMWSLNLAYRGDFDSPRIDLDTTRHDDFDLACCNFFDTSADGGEIVEPSILGSGHSCQ